MNYIVRTLEKTVLELSGEYAMILVAGPRGSGKTTMLRKMADDRGMNFVTLKEEGEKALAERDPEGFLEEHRPPLFVDHIDEVPSLLSALQQWAHGTERKGVIWLAARDGEEVIRNSPVTLAGDLILLHLLPLSQAEIDGLDLPPFRLPLSISKEDRKKYPSRSGTEIYKEIWTGSFPAIRGGAVERNVYYAGYVTNLIEEDVKGLTRLRSSRRFLDFLMDLAAWDGQSLNYDGIARETGVTAITARKWVRILEELGILFLLPTYRHAALKRGVRTPKLYFIDTGLVCYLRSRKSPVAAMAGALKEVLFENYVVSEIRKSYIHRGKKADLYYYREPNRWEIQLLAEHEETIFPLEIDTTTHPALSRAEDFTLLDGAGLPRSPGSVLCLMQGVRDLGRGIMAFSMNFLG